MRGLGRTAVAVVAIFAMVAAIPATAGAEGPTPPVDFGGLVVPAVAPSIGSFTPTQGALGAIVTITGSGLSGITAVKFAGVTAQFTVVSATSIHATVPNLAKTGKITVAGPSGTATSTATFTVLPGIALSPTVGPPTTKFTVSGSGFGPTELVDLYEGATDVVLATTDADGRFSGAALTVPTYATPGALWISAAGRHSQKAAQKAFTVRTDWAEPRRTIAGAGWNPYETVLDPSSVGRLELAWTTTAGSYFSNVSPGVIVASNLIVEPLPHIGKLVALHPDGRQAWSRPLSSGYFAAPGAAAAGGIVVVPSTDGKVHAFNLMTGAPKWTSAGPSDTGNGSAVVVGTRVIAPGATKLQAFDLHTGAVQWSYGGSCAGNLSTPAVAAGLVVETCTDSGGAPILMTLATDGTPRVSQSTSAGATSAPAIAGGNVYLLFGGNLTTYSFSGFYAKWAVAPPFSIFATPAVGDGLVATCGSGGVWVVSAVDGSTRFSDAAYPCVASPTIAGGVIYVPQNGGVIMFTEYGSRLGRLATGGSAGPVVVVDGSVYAGEGISGVDRWIIPTGAAQQKHRTVAAPNVRQLHPRWSLEPPTATPVTDE